MHGTYAPRLLARPGVLWAAHYASEKNTVHAHSYPGRFAQDVPAGNDFILLFGAESAEAFARPVPAKLHAGLPATDRDMLAMRIGERANIFIEQTRADGPEAGTRDPTAALSPCIQLGTLNAQGYRDEDEMLDRRFPGAHLGRQHARAPVAGGPPPAAPAGAFFGERLAARDDKMIPIRIIKPPLRSAPAQECPSSRDQPASPDALSR